MIAPRVILFGPGNVWGEGVVGSAICKEPKTGCVNTDPRGVVPIKLKEKDDAAAAESLNQILHSHGQEEDVYLFTIHLPFIRNFKTPPPAPPSLSLSLSLRGCCCDL